jgi:hypothetical protein
VSISLAKLDKIVGCKERADVYVGNVTITKPDPIADEIRRHEEIAFRVHRLCEDVWGADPLWYVEETRPDCRFSVKANDEEISVWDFMKGCDRTFDRNDIEKPGFNIAEVFANPEPNRTPTSVREGGYPDAENYQPYDWPAVYWLYKRLLIQLEFADEGNAPEGTNPENRVDVQPTMSGYCIQLDESDIVYNVTHEEVLDVHFSPEWIIDHMISARRIPAENRGDRFEDKRLTGYMMLMLGMTRIPGHQTKIRKRGNRKRVTGGEG